MKVVSIPESEKTRENITNMLKLRRKSDIECEGNAAIASGT